MVEKFQSRWDGYLEKILVAKHSNVPNFVDVVPIHTASYWAGPWQLVLKKKNVDQIVSADVADPVTTGWEAPIVFVPKKNGSLRSCVNYLRLIDLTERYSFPITETDKRFDALGAEHLFLTLHVNSGYL